MVVSSDDMVDCEGGMGDASVPIHSFDQDEVKNLQRVFSQVDADGSKELEYPELATVFVKWGLENVTEAEVETLIKRFDVNKNGKLDFDEFLGLAAAAKSLADGDDESMEATIRTHFAREHAKMKSLMVRQKFAVDAATLKFFKDEAKFGAHAKNSIERAARVARQAVRDLGADEGSAEKAHEHVQRRLTGPGNPARERFAF